MSVGAGDRPSFGALRAADGRDLPAAGAGGDFIIGSERVSVLERHLQLSVQPDLTVRVRLYGDDQLVPVLDLATSPDRAMRIAALFRQAALRAGVDVAQVPPEREAT